MSIPEKIERQFPGTELVRQYFDSEYEWRGQSECFTIKKLDENLLYRTGRVLQWSEDNTRVEGTEFFIVVPGIDLPLIPISPNFKTPKHQYRKAYTIGQEIHNYIHPTFSFYVVQVDFSFDDAANYALYTIYKTEDAQDLVNNYFNALIDYEFFCSENIFKPEV